MLGEPTKGWCFRCGPPGGLPGGGGGPIDGGGPQTPALGVFQVRC